MFEVTKRFTEDFDRRGLLRVVEREPEIDHVVGQADVSYADDSAFDATFSLKANGTPLSSDTKRNAIGSTINHLIHHRGQLTVYLKMRGAKIPSIYGPSADDRNFSPTFS